MRGLQHECASRKSFFFQDKSFILRDAPSCTQNTRTLPVMGYTLLPSCLCLCVSRVVVIVGFCGQDSRVEIRRRRNKDIFEIHHYLIVSYSWWLSFTQRIDLIPQFLKVKDLTYRLQSPMWSTTSKNNIMCSCMYVWFHKYIICFHATSCCACVLLSRGGYFIFLTACRLTTHTNRPDILGDNEFCVNEKCICPLHLFIKEEDFSSGMPSRDVALTCQAACRHFTHKVFNKTSKQHNSNTNK